MSEQELIDQVTSKLTGTLYVGQSVSLHPSMRCRVESLYTTLKYDYFTGVVVELKGDMVVIKTPDGKQHSFGYEWITG